MTGDAKLELDGAGNVDLDHITVDAEGAGNSSTIFVAYAHGVRIHDSTFTHCGDRSPDFANCITLNRGAHGVTIDHDSFHDCHYRCRHNDLIQLFAGRWLRVERNHFGVYRRLPYYAKVVNNTILTGSRRRNGYLGSIRMSSAYGGVRLWKRPIIADNVIALLGDRWPVYAYRAAVSRQRRHQRNQLPGRPTTREASRGAVSRTARRAPTRARTRA